MAAKKKKRKASKKKSEGWVHVRLDGPISKRKKILTAAISVVELMKRQDRIRELRTERHKEMEIYRGLMKEFHYMLGQLGLKEVKLKTVKSSVKSEAPVKVKKKKAVPKPVVKRGSGLDVQLDALRRKLQTM
jgi:hypothetical protein